MRHAVNVAEYGKTVDVRICNQTGRKEMKKIVFALGLMMGFEALSGKSIS